MSKPVHIIGGGLAGLACAVRLLEGGMKPLIIESSDAVGGRVRTDCVEGFLLDRGFQVYLSAYPEAGKLLDLEALDLRPFRPGALVFKQGKRHRLMDAFRCPQHALTTVAQPIGTLKDKLLVGGLRLAVKRLTEKQILGKGDRTTEAYLREYGFSEEMIDDFFRAFYGGIFLERELQTSSHMFQFTFKMFATGFATLPRAGMQAIPDQLAARLPKDAVRLGDPVRAVTKQLVTLESGQSLPVETLVVATDGETARKLAPNLPFKDVSWRSVIGMYFVADQSPLDEPIIALNSDKGGLINNVCVLSDVSSQYAPDGKALISVSVLTGAQENALVGQVRKELLVWFGPVVNDWRHLRSYTIRKGLPEQLPTATPHDKAHQVHEGIHFCGDYLSTASIEGAIRSGLTCAESILTHSS